MSKYRMKRCQLFCLQGTLRYLKYHILFKVSAVSRFFCQRRCYSVNALFSVLFVCFWSLAQTGAVCFCRLWQQSTMTASLWRLNCVSSLRVLLQGWRSHLKNVQALENKNIKHIKKSKRSCRKVWTDCVLVNLILSTHPICEHCCSVELQEAADVLLIPKIQIK